MRKLIDTSLKAVKLNIDESASEVDGVHVLAKVRGPFFIPDGTSRNERHYPRDLWEQVCSSKKIREQITERNMFGCIAHETPLTDESWRDGKFSHIITKFGLDENGEPDCEALILGTPSGQILNTCIRAGSKVYVSTRADGDFKGTTEEGIPIVDKDNYDFQTVDFVLKPGFLNANPKLEESLTKEIQNLTLNKNEGSMELKDMVEELTKKNLKLSEEAEKAQDDAEAAKSELEVVKKENDALKGENEEMKKVGESFTKFKKIVEAETEEIAAKKASELQDYQKVGTVGDAQAAINKAKELDDLTKELGTPDVIKESFKVLEAVAAKYKKLVEEFGGEEDIKKMSDEFETVVADKEKEKEQEKKESLAKKLHVKTSVIEKLLAKKMTLESIESTMLALKEEDMVGKEDDEDSEDDEEVVEAEGEETEDSEEETDESEEEEDEDSYQKGDDQEEVIESKKSKKSSSTSRLFESFAR